MNKYHVIRATLTALIVTATKETSVPTRISIQNAQPYGTASNPIHEIASCGIHAAGYTVEGKKKMQANQETQRLELNQALTELAREMCSSPLSLLSVQEPQNHVSGRVSGMHLVMIRATKTASHLR